MPPKRKARSSGGLRESTGRKQQRIGSAQRANEGIPRTPTARRLDQSLDIQSKLQSLYDEHTCSCESCDPKRTTWRESLKSTAVGGPNSEAYKAQGLAEGPWALTPGLIVHYFERFATDDLPYMVRFLWECHEKYGAKEVPWGGVWQFLNSGCDGVWTRQNLEAAKREIPLLVEVDEEEGWTRDEEDEDIMRRVAEDLNSSRTVRTFTLRYILQRFRPMMKVLDLHHLIHSRSSEQALEATDRRTPEGLCAISEHDIEVWSPIKINCTESDAFVIPFTTCEPPFDGHPQLSSGLYALSEGECSVYHAAYTDLFNNILPEKLIKAVAGPDAASTWKIRHIDVRDSHDHSGKDQAPNGYFREEDYGLQAIGHFLHDPSPHDRSGELIAFRVDSGLWRAIIAGLFDKKASKTQPFESWWKRRWSTQKMAAGHSTENPDGSLSMSDDERKYFPKTAEASEKLAEARQRQCRLEHVIDHDLGDLIKQVRFANTTIIKEIDEIKVRLFGIQSKYDQEVKQLGKKIVLALKASHSKLGLGFDDERIKALAKPTLEILGIQYKEACEKEKTLTKKQLSMVDQVYSLQVQLGSVLLAGKAFLTSMSAKSKDEVKRAELLFNEVRSSERRSSRWR